MSRVRGENRKLKEGRDILSKTMAWFATKKRDLAGIVKANAATHSVGGDVPIAADFEERERIVTLISGHDLLKCEPTKSNPFLERLCGEAA